MKKDKKNKKPGKNEKPSKKGLNPLTIADQIEETVMDSVNAAAKALADWDDDAPAKEEAVELPAENTSELSEEISGDGAVDGEITVTVDPTILATPETMESEGLILEGEEEAVEGEEKLPQNLELVQVRSIIESLLLAYDKPVNMSLLREVFKGTNTKTDVIKRALSDLMVEYAGAERGMSINEVGGGYQMRTKSENQVFVRRLTKGRPFKLSGPSLEVLSIISYKQPIIKSEVDSIRGVESGHLVRALMDRGLVKFVGKSELPGKPMLYGTTRKFLEIFGLRDLRELPSLAEIDDLIPEGMLDDESAEKEENWETVQDMSLNYQQDHQKDEEWVKITEEISKIETTTTFFEDEKKREKQLREQERAEDLRESLLNGKEISNKDKKWLDRYEMALAAAASDLAPAVEAAAAGAVAEVVAEVVAEAAVEATAETASVEATSVSEEELPDFIVTEGPPETDFEVEK